MTKILDEPFNDLTNWVDETGTATIVAGRTGTAMELTSTGRRRYEIPLAPRSTTVTLGFACKLSALSVLVPLVALRSAGDGTQPGAVNNTVQINTNGSVDVRRGTSTVLATSSTGLVTANTWFYLEARIFHKNTGGTAQVRVNNTQVIDFTGDTNNGFTDITNYVNVALASAASITTLFDDFYLSNGDAFEGDHAIGAPTVKVWNGSTFVSAPVNVWNGSSFVAATAVKTWNGSAFV